MERRFFDNLNGLRFFAAITVAISHLETIKSYQNNHYLKNRFIEHSAQLAVTFFSVLSGYLISWWFLEDTKGVIDRINVRTFYIRRFSRTWPLYFIIIFLSFLIGVYGGEFNHDNNFVNRYITYLLFLPNTADLNYDADIYLGQTWSLAVEEFFYLLFPLFLVTIRKQFLVSNYILVLSIFLFFSVLFNPIFIHLTFDKYAIPKPHSYLITFFERYRIYAFLLGGLAAWIFYYHEKRVRILMQSTYRLFCNGIAIAVVFFFLTGITFSFLTHQLYAILFAFFILFFVCTDKSYWLLTNKLIKNGGKYSYGIYMLHMFVVMRLTNQGSFLYDVENKSLSIVISWIILLILILIISHFSYHYLERPIQEKIVKFYTKRIR